MPKTSDTRKQRARELLRRLKDGPHFSEPRGSAFQKPHDASWDNATDGFAAQHRLWSETWIIPEILRLVPELREK